MKKMRSDNKTKVTYQEVIGFLIDGIIYTGTNSIKMVIEKQDYDEIITRKRIQFMCHFDLGKVWEKLLKCPTLFYLDKNNNPTWIKRNI